MVSLVKIAFSIIFFAFFASSAASRVIELSDRFLDIHKEGQWLVMMYAPWCAHCKRLEPVWAHVAQYLYSSSVRVGRIDCTRFTNVAHTFKIRGFPTILFLKGDQQFIYDGDRTKDELVKFAMRLSGPTVQEITRTQSFDTIKNDRDIYFLYVGDKIGHLWDIYYKTADKYQQHAFFYQSHKDIVDNHAPVIKIPTIFVYKENLHYNFSINDDNDYDKINDTMQKWINSERFPTFPKVTRGNINQLFLTNKNLVLAVVEENAVEDISQDMIEFRDMVESVIKNKRHKYHDYFQFGWISNTELVNSIAMMEMTKPSLLVINTSTSHHHIPDDEPSKLTPQAIELFLEHIQNDTATRYGGNNIVVRFYRWWFETKMTLASMWKGNPILTMLLFGLPALFLSLIFYGICCPDILDAGDDDEEEEDESNDSSHMKKD